MAIKKAGFRPLFQEIISKPTGFRHNLKRFSLAVTIFSLLLTACARQHPPQMEFVLGTVCRIHLYEGGSKKLYSRIFARIREIDRTMTAFPGEFEDVFSEGGLGASGAVGASGAHVEPDSKAAEKIRAAAETLTSGVVAINRQAGIEPVKVRADLIEVLETALHYAELSGGAFDPTVGPLVQLWGIGTDNQRVPGDEEIAAALQLVNWRDVVVDRDAGTVFLRRHGMALDLGAIAKGYAGDEALRIAKEAKVKRAVFDLGGNIVTLGWRMEAVRGRKTAFTANKELLPWRIGIQNPLTERGDYIGVVQVHDQSVVTSGIYERFFIADGNHYHHILSTTNGYPIENSLLSVTIITDSSTIADALSTTVFALGFERGKALIDSTPNTEAIFVFDNRSVMRTSGLAENFSLTGNEFVMR